MSTQKHICGTCEKEFATEADYLKHKCVTGHKPTDIEHQDVLTNGAFSRQSTKALERGDARKGETQHPAAGK